MLELLTAGTLLVATCWLLAKVNQWWFLGSIQRDISLPANQARRVADWQARIAQARADVEYYTSNPDWFDDAWPVCDRLTISSDGTYCTNCFRASGIHAPVQVPA